ncbi:hypothetical protein NMG60_11023662 [Bertholletia excelsa]
MTDHPQGVRTRRGSRNTVRGRSFAVFFFWVALIFTQLCLSCAVRHHIAPSAPRKARFFGAAANSVHPATSPTQFAGDDSVYREAKRLVHTGPNPLHN